MVETQKVNPTKKGGKNAGPRKQDTREPKVIFAERFNTEARLMTRRFKNLSSLANAKRARPTGEQLEQVEEWLRSKTEECVRELRKRYEAKEEQEEAAGGNFAILPEAPAKVAPTTKKS